MLGIEFNYSLLSEEMLSKEFGATVALQEKNAMVISIFMYFT
jgi:hypothetical protein